MIAPVTAPDGRMVSIHRTFLTEAGGKAHGPQSKKLMPVIAPGSTRGAAIRLFPTGEQLGVAEGIETALACHLLFQIPVWAAISSGGLARIDIPREVKRVEIFPDHDTPGIEAAKALGRRLIRSGRHFRIWTPPNPRSDWADVLFERANAERDTITNSREAE
jgi:putative DNA primase/helicase